MIEITKVGMADLKAVAYPNALTTLGLGSCVGVALYDKTSRVIGLAHVMLPSSQQTRNNLNVAKFADTAIVKLIEEMVTLGANKKHIVAKIAGGAQMFALTQSSDLMKIGLRNTQACKEKLSELNIPLLAEDTGGNFGRTIEVYADDGRLMVKTLGHGIRNI